MDANYTCSTAKSAEKTIVLVKTLQKRLVEAMEQVDKPNTKFEPIHWLRDKGNHGGGTRFVAPEGSAFNRASVNFSHVHYDDQPEKKMAFASALSAIIHPKNPLCPSTHLHFSWTEMKDGGGYWRLMADLNPSHPNNKDKSLFEAALKEVTGEFYEEGNRAGDTYFYIPALDKHRGVSHFYLEGFNRGNFEEDSAFTKRVACKMIMVYASILSNGLKTRKDVSIQEKQTQIDYHTLYMYQVLTLDKGTIAGVLVHDQNDLGVMGSIPAEVNANLLESWGKKTPDPMHELVEVFVNILGKGNAVKVGDEQKLAIVKAIRIFYQKYPEKGVFKTGPIRSNNGNGSTR